MLKNSFIYNGRDFLTLSALGVGVRAVGCALCACVEAETAEASTRAEAEETPGDDRLPHAMIVPL